MLRVDVTRHDDGELTSSPLLIDLLDKFDGLTQPPWRLVGASTDTGKLIDEEEVNISEPVFERIARSLILPTRLNLIHDLDVADIAHFEIQVSGLTSEAVKQRGLAVTWLTI
jgi:hypothetical protein